MLLHSCRRVLPALLALSVLAGAWTVVGSTPQAHAVQAPPVVTQVLAPGPSAARAVLPVAFPPARNAPKYVATLGSTGAVVRKVQRVVRVPVDGVYGPKTAKAVRVWQGHHRLPTTGNVDAATWAKINAAAAARQPRPAVPKAVHGPTSWTALNHSIGRIPGYRSGIATWIVTARYGHWGTSDLGNGDIFISPAVPASRLYSVAVHEYAHALASVDYGRDWRAMDAGIDRWFGANGRLSREWSADCMARLDGATWTHYTPCSSAHWRQGARLLLAGRRLPG
jgi:Putative peptidoglycan binding domain